jgi:16S rRNA pseudouridine516 synthase
MFISPKREIDKEYQVTVDKPLTDTLIKEFAAGTLLLEKEPKPCLPAKLTIIDETHAQVVLHEGRYHQVKRMFAHFGYTVTELHRSRFGEYKIDTIKEGEWIDLKMPL